MVFNNKLAVPVALGLSIVTVTAFVIYYVFKKEEENESNNKSQIKTAKMNVIEVSVPKSIVPALIGRSGSNIKEIERKSGANIIFKKFNDRDSDICIIRGRAETAQLAETMVHEFIGNQPVIEEDSMTVPSWAVGRIIGTRGENINDISHRSGARVKIEGYGHSESSAMRQVTFRGTRQQIQTARTLIDNSVSQEKCRREIEQAKRSPRHTQSPSRSSTGAEPEMPETTGAAIEVYVSAVSSPSRFWVQFVGAQVAQLDDLVQLMTDYYSNKDNQEAHALSSVSVGQVVAAVFRHDGRWYRARVTDIRPNEFDASQQVADVFYLDYGDSEYVATHELYELRADLLRLRFQAMECFLAGVVPKGSEQQTVGVTSTGQRWDKWPNEAIERFEELTQVARWKSLVSKTCTYKKAVTCEGEKEKEIPGIKLFDVTEQGELDIGATLIAEGWAEEAPPAPTAPHPAHPTPATPFGDLGNSRVLGMTSDRSTSLPRDSPPTKSDTGLKPVSTSLASGLEKSDHPTSTPSINSVSLAYPGIEPKPQVNGSHDSFLNLERQNQESQRDTASSETLVPSPSPKLGKSQRDELKANMNRIDSHHNNLEALGRSHNEHM